MIRTLTVLSALLLSTSAFAEGETPAAAAPATDAAAKAAPAAPAQAATPAPEAATLAEFTYVPKESDIVFGKPDAPVTLVEYASLSCSHCAAFYKEVFPDLQKYYLDTGRAKLVYRHYPLNQPALDAAQMVQCADKDARKAYIKVLFTTQDKWAYDAGYREALAGIAVLGGMDRKKFDECLANKDLQSSILLTYQEAKDSYNVSSTPTLFLDNEMVKGNHSYDSISLAIDKALNAKRKK